MKIVNSGDKFSHASVETFHCFEGKQFVKDVTGATSCEISFGSLPSGASVPFFIVIKKMKRTILFFLEKEDFK